MIKELEEFLNRVEIIPDNEQEINNMYIKFRKEYISNNTPSFDEYLNVDFRHLFIQKVNNYALTKIYELYKVEEKD